MYTLITTKNDLNAEAVCFVGKWSNTIVILTVIVIKRVMVLAVTKATIKKIVIVTMIKK